MSKLLASLDAYHGKDGPVKEIENTLSPPKYDWRLPWFAKITGEGGSGVSSRLRGTGLATALHKVSSQSTGVLPIQVIALQKLRCAPHQ